MIGTSMLEDLGSLSRNTPLKRDRERSLYGKHLSSSEPDMSLGLPFLDRT
jgi:hypothetical protein